jgi:hypothetical protein
VPVVAVGRNSTYRGEASASTQALGLMRPVVSGLRV